MTRISADMKLNAPAIHLACRRRLRKPAPREACQPLAGGFPTKSGHPRSRRGAFVVVVMICLLVAGMLLGSLLKMALRHDRQLEREQASVQAEWLADSALARAAARLARDPDYAGETWTIDEARLGGPEGAVVIIRVQKDKIRTHSRLIVVEATYPAEGPQQARRSRQATVAISQES